VTGGRHRNDARIGVDATERARARQRTARIRLAAVKLAPTAQAKSLVPAQRMTAPSRTISIGMSNVLATSASSPGGTGTGARGPAPEAQKAAALAAEACQANWSAPSASAAAIAHWPRLLSANIPAP
jgi:hypothetical protein